MNSGRTSRGWMWAAVLLLLLSLACAGSGSGSASSSRSEAAPTAKPVSAPTAVTVDADTGNNSAPDDGDMTVGETLPGNRSTVGTIRATVDGKSRTWTVVDDGSCLWGAIVNGKKVGLIGYERPDSVAAEQINLNQSIWPDVWKQPYDLGASRIILLFDIPGGVQSQGALDLASSPRNGAAAGDFIFMSYTTAGGDFIHGNTTIQGEYTVTGDGSLDLSGRFTTSGFAERDSDGLEQLPGVTDGTFTLTHVRVLDLDTVIAWRSRCSP